MFEVDEKTYIRSKSLYEELDQAINVTSGGYIAIIGSPGSGKSTAITQYIQKYEIRSKQPVIKYYCFTSLTDPASHRRLTKTEFLDSIIEQLQLASRSISPEIASDARSIKYVGYHSNEEKRFNLILERLKTFLQKLSLYLEVNAKKLLFVVDGIDHVARANIDENNKLLSVLPYPLPKNIVGLIGTQSIQFLPTAIQRECLSNNLIEMPRFNELQIRQYVNRFGDLSQILDGSHLMKIVSLTQGIPLYLRYLAIYLQSASSHADTIDRLNTMPIYNGDIENYYWTLWTNLKSLSHQQTEVKICELLARSPFPLSKGDLVSLIKEDIHNVVDALKDIEHLLYSTASGYRIFHESFRVFIDKATDDLIKQTTDALLFNYLEASKNEQDLWYRYCFRFAFQIQNYQYLVDRANASYVEISIANGRSKYELIENLRLATEAASKLNKLPELARISGLIAHTSIRSEYHLNEYELFEGLVLLGEVKQAIELIAPNEIIQESTLDIGKALVFLASKNYDQAQKLAEQYFDGLPRKIDTVDWVTVVARLLTIFSDLSPATLASWMNNTQRNGNVTRLYDLLWAVLSSAYDFNRFSLKRLLKQLLIDGPQRSFWKGKWYLYTAFLEATHKSNTAIHHVYTAANYAHEDTDRILLAGLAVKLNGEAEFVDRLISNIVLLPQVDNTALGYIDDDKHFEIFRAYISALLL